MLVVKSQKPNYTLKKLSQKRDCDEDITVNNKQLNLTTNYWETSILRNIRQYNLILV